MTWTGGRALLICQIGYDRRNGIAVFRLPRLPQAVMHLYHDLMKVNAALAADIKAVEEQVHQHGLAPSYPAPHIEPPWRRGRAPPHFPKRAPVRRRISPFPLQCAGSVVA